MERLHTSCPKKPVRLRSAKADKTIPLSGCFAIMSLRDVKQKEYTNGEVTILWKPSLCIHSEKCVRNLPGVFDADRRPWIDPTAADSESIVETVKKCPSGALDFSWNDGRERKSQAGSNQVKVMPDGPLLVSGAITIELPDGSTLQQEGPTALCRCGASGKKPFCDGSHRKVDFKG